jgi:DNA-binding transcriptional LysR family regulator
MLEAKDIDLNLLVVFHEIFQERHISTVAKKLHLSQPAISNALARLRLSFNDELFVRTSKGMQPTPTAYQLADPIAEALNKITRALNQHDTFDVESSQRHFTIAMTDVGEMYFMPQLISYCAKHAPQIKIKSMRAHSVNLLSEMEMGRIDLAVGAFDSLSGTLFQRRLFKQNYVTMFRRGHRTMKEGMTSKQFLSAKHLIVSSQESPYDKINQSLEKIGITASAHFIVPHFSSAPYIISSTDLVVTVPEKLAISAKQAFDLEYIKPPLRLPNLQTNVFWHRRFAQDEGNVWLRDTLVNLFAS